MKVNRYTIGEATLIFSFCLPTKWWSNLKGKNLLPYEQILSFKSYPIVDELSSREDKWKSVKVIPLCKIMENINMNPTITVITKGHNQRHSACHKLIKEHLFRQSSIWNAIKSFCLYFFERKNACCGEAHKNTEKFAIFIQCHINIVKLNTFIKLFSATNILK